MPRTVARTDPDAQRDQTAECQSGPVVSWRCQHSQTQLAVRRMHSACAA